MALSRRTPALLCALIAVAIPAAAFAAGPTNPENRAELLARPSMSKVAGSLKIQVIQKLDYLADPRPETFRPLELQGLAGRPIRTTTVDLRLDAYPDGELRRSLEAAGAVLYDETWLPPFGGHVTGHVLARVPTDRVLDLAEIPGVRELRSAEMVSWPQNDLGALDVGANVYWSSSFTGAGVRVGVLDSGLEVAHDDIPTPVVARDYSGWPSIDGTIGNQVTGHGTHVAGTVLGRGTLSSGTYKGMAHGADLVFMKIGNDANAGASFDAEEQAIRACVDSFACDVITMSYGGWDTYHDGTSSPALAADYAWSQGAIVFFSAGNDGNDDMHYSEASLAGGATSGFIQVDASSVPNNTSVILLFNLVWYDGDPSTDLELLYYDGAMNPISPASITDFGQSESSRGTESQYTRYDSFLPAGSSTWFLRVKNNSGTAVGFHLYYSPAFNLAGGNFVNFASPDSFYTVSSPANSDSAIAVGAHVTRTSWIQYTGSGPWGYGYTLDDLAPFSSRGPTVTGVQKPQITAPGSAIISARDHDVIPLSSGNLLIVDDDGTNDGPPADYYVSQGTSMSCPMAAGATALMREVNPSLPPAVARHLIQGLARSDGFTGSVPNDTWGYGKLDVAALMPYLSVESVSFLYRFEEGGVVLRWTTVGERNNEGFHVLRSEAGEETYGRITDALIPSAAPEGGGAEYTYRDESVQPGRLYYYKVREVDADGSTRDHGPYKVTLAVPYALEQNHPNPFNPTTTITYSIPAPERVTLRVYDVGGREVRTLVDAVKRPGRYEVIWDGTDARGRTAASGIYFYRLEAGKFSRTMKMMMVK
jgi:subtilisin family serine protease